MKRFLMITTLLLVVVPSFSQWTKKELQQKIIDSRDAGSNYVILSSGEKKEITSATLPNNYGKAGQIIFPDGSKWKYFKSDIQSIQTNEGFYKEITVNPDHGRGTATMASRISKGHFNVYQAVVHYNKMGRDGWVTDTYYFFEKADGTGFMQFQNDYKHVDHVDSLVSKSTAAKESIAEIRKAKGKIQIKWSVQSKLADTIDLYNKDAAAGKLEK